MAKGKYILYYTVMQEQYDDVIMYDDNISELIKYIYYLAKYDDKLNVAITLTEHFERGSWNILFEIRDGKLIVDKRTKEMLYGRML